MKLTFRYPGQFAWEISAPKRVVRKSQPFKQFQKFLVGETEVVSSCPIYSYLIVDVPGKLEQAGGRVDDSTSVARRSAAPHRTCGQITK